jgi:YesN/AraC family two-component response regulator
MDVEMPDMDGVEAIHLVCQSNPRTTVLILSMLITALPNVRG